MGDRAGRFGIIGGFIRRHIGSYAAGVALLLGVDALQLLIPRVLGSVADLYAQGTLTAPEVAAAAGRLLGLAALISAGRWGWRHFLLGVSRHLEAELRRRLFAHLQQVPVARFTRRRVGDLMAHLTHDVQAVRMAAGHGVVLLVDVAFMTFSVAAMMAFTVDARLFALAAGPLVAASAGLVALGRRVHRRTRAVQEGFSRLCAFVEENVSGIRVVKLFGREEAQRAIFDGLARDLLHRQLALARVGAFMAPLSELAVAASFVALLGVGGFMVLDGRISLGDFVAFTSYIGLLVWPLTAAGWLINMIERGRASLERIEAILSEPPEPGDAPGACGLGRVRGRIEVRGLTFIYPGGERPALENLSFTVEPGETVGIVGPSGSGKTTLALLLLRLYDPPEGTLFVDGCDLRSLPLAGWRRQVGYVPQEPFLFSESLADNIAFGLDRNGEARDGAVMRAARLAHLDGDVKSFPRGYEALVGERGLALSGGQKQRAAIARAIVKDPRLFILDDALSSVDALTERAILQDLGRVLAGRTAIFIAHRVSVVRHAHRILVLDGGRMVEQGTHDELLARGGLYARMYRLQALEGRVQGMGG